MDADSSTWTILAGFNRWALYASMLIGAGSALFLLITPAPERASQSAHTLGRVAALATVFFYVAALGLGGAEIMTGGADTLITGSTWEMGASTSLGHSAALGVPAMLILWLGFNWNQRALLAAGAAGGILSFLVTGHAATAVPVWLTAPAVAVHLTGAAYWIGALFPLYRATRDHDPHTASALIVAFSQRAVWFVSAIVASGLIISWIQLDVPVALITTSYGFRLIAKIALFALLLALAAYNKLVLTPRITSGQDAATHLRQIIRVEFFVLVLVLGAAVSLTLTEPPRALDHGAPADAGHSHP
ncbi:MAG: CopD family protein [Rhodospirillaceae bacterium]|nr:CopD family protein [Rhodospirillaceae bacterium]